MKFEASAVEKIIEYEFKDKSLLKQALSHKSYSYEKKKGYSGSNERLEFLGDAVLELVSSKMLYFAYPNMREGKMSKLRAKMVCEPALYECAKKIGLEKYILLGYGEEQSGGRNRASIVSDCMEAVIGAVFIDSGMDAAQAFINKKILFDIDNFEYFSDNKTALQEVLQAKGKVPVYEVILQEGPSHDRTFTVSASDGDRILGTGIGKSKKAAEQAAAKEALKILQEEN